MPIAGVTPEPIVRHQASRRPSRGWGIFLCQAAAWQTHAVAAFAELGLADLLAGGPLPVAGDCSVRRGRVVGRRSAMADAERARCARAVTSEEVPRV
jgi:hypothetical protein